MNNGDMRILRREVGRLETIANIPKNRPLDNIIHQSGRSKYTIF